MLPTPWTEVVLAASAFALFLALHLPLWAWRGSDLCGFGLMVALWLLALAVVLGTIWYSTLGGLEHWLTVVAVDGALMAVYLHLYTGMLRSVSLRLLGELHAADGSLTRPDLLRVYSPTSMLESRLDWLVGRGWLDRRDDTYQLTAAGRRVLAIRRPLAALLVRGPTG